MLNSEIERLKEIKELIELDSNLFKGKFKNLYIKAIEKAINQLQIDMEVRGLNYEMPLEVFQVNGWYSIKRQIVVDRFIYKKVVWEYLVLDNDAIYWSRRKKLMWGTNRIDTVSHMIKRCSGLDAMGKEEFVWSSEPYELV